LRRRGRHNIFFYVFNVIFALLCFIIKKAKRKIEGGGEAVEGGGEAAAAKKT